MSNNSVRLDIGGKKFHTSIDTLTGRETDSMIAVMFSGHHTLDRDDDGYIFIDRDGKHFRHILNWLWDGVIPTLEDSGYCELLREAEYYQLAGLVHELNVRISEKSEELSSYLTRTEFIGRQFDVVKQTRISLRGIYLSRIDLSFRVVKFHGVDLGGVSFEGIDAQGVIFDKANLEGCNFMNSKIREASFIMAKPPKHTVSFNDISLWIVNFNNCILRNVKFVGAIIQAAFDNVDAQGVIFDDATFNHCSFNNSNIREASFCRAKLRGYSIDLRTTKFDDATFNHCSFNNSNIREASFCRAKLRGYSIDLRTTKFINCCFVGADLSCIKYMKGADFKGSDLTYANLGSWQIQDFNGAKL